MARKSKSWPAPPDGVRRISDAWVWRNAILDPSGPADPMTRYVLLVMSTFMNPDGSRCFPGIRDIGARAKLNKDTVTKHRNAAIALGFLIPPTTGVHARGRQEWSTCLPPEAPAVSDPFGHCKGSSVRNDSLQCPATPDIPAHTSMVFEENGYGF